VLEVLKMLIAQTNPTPGDLAGNAILVDDEQ
jgi:hypothetical protein